MTMTAKASTPPNADAAAFAGRIGAPEDDVRQALADPAAVRQVMQERGLSEDLVVFLLVANVQSRRRKDVVVTLPA